jgi:hypothetical protein
MRIYYKSRIVSGSGGEYLDAVVSGRVSGYGRMNKFSRN